MTEENQAQPLFERDPIIRNGYWGGYLLAGFLIIVSVVGIVRLSWWWTIPIPLAGVAIVANSRTRWATSYRQAAGWFVLLAVGLGGSIAACAVLLRAAR